MQTVSQINYIPRTALIILVASMAVLAILLTTFGLVYLDSKWVFMSLTALMLPFILMMIKNLRNVLLFLLVFTYPLNIDYNFIWTMSPSGSNFLGVRLTDIIVLFLLGHVLLESFQEKRVGYFKFFPHISVPTVAFITFCALSMLAATNLLSSVIEIVDYVKIFIFFFVLANSIRTSRDLKTVIVGLFLGVIVQVIIVALQYYKGSTLGLAAIGLGENPEILQFQMISENVPRPGGTVGLCNSVARYFGLIVPIAFSLTLVSRSRVTRWLAGSVSLITTIGLIYTLTRSAWLGTLIAFAMMFPFFIIRRLATMRMMVQMVFVAVVFSVLLAVYGHILYGRLVSDDYGSARSRLTTAKVAFKVIKDHPFLGVGINNYGNVLEQYWDSTDTFTRRAAVHNTFLQYVAEIGIVGFAAYLWLLVAAFMRIRRAIRSRSDFLAAVAVGILGSYFFFIISALPAIANKNNITVVLSFWGLLAVTEAINRMSAEHEEAALELLSGRKWINEF
jgi:putative inorganic carbon (hco3(-)) transporter